MTIGERIKRRRDELNMTVDQLANKLGKNRATIYRYEKDEIENFPTTVLEPLAKALFTTPAYLMGWDEDTNHLGEEKIIKASERYKVKGIIIDSFGEDVYKTFNMLINLNEEAKEKAQEYINDLYANIKYRKTVDKKIHAFINSVNANNDIVELGLNKDGVILTEKIILEHSGEQYSIPDDAWELFSDEEQ